MVDKGYSIFDMPWLDWFDSLVVKPKKLTIRKSRGPNGIFTAHLVEFPFVKVEGDSSTSVEFEVMDKVQRIVEKLLEINEKTEFEVIEPVFD